MPDRHGGSDLLGTYDLGSLIPVIWRDGYSLVQRFDRYTLHATLDWPC
jgi:hypothetical protein